MYRYTEFDRQFVRARAAQYRDQLQRHLAGDLSTDDFRPLRLQNGWYLERHAPMLRVAIPYGALSSAQLRLLARVAREFDEQDAGLPTQRGGYAHFTTRQNIQFNWIPLERSADVMDLLATADLHGIQTSGSCIRNIISDGLAGIAPDEIVDPRPFCELLRQWSTLHPEFAFLPRKFKIAVNGAREDRAALRWHDIGLQLLRNAKGEVGFAVYVGGGMGRTPAIAAPSHAFVPWRRILVYLEAILRVYNRYGRRDNLYKSRIKILVRSEGRRFFDAVNLEFQRLLSEDVAGSQHLITPEALARVAAHFAEPAGLPAPPADPFAGIAGHPLAADMAAAVLAHQTSSTARPEAAPPKAFTRWLERNVHPHRLAHLRAVTLSLKRPGQAPGDVTAAQMDAAADLADRFSQGELRVTHEQNLLLPWVPAAELSALWVATRELGFATPHIGQLTDLISCPGGDLCSLANARSIPVAAQILQRFGDLDRLDDIGDLKLHLSGCINSCGHHHSGHIGILGVDKDGAEWYQITLGGSDGTDAGGTAIPGKVVGPAFAADEVVDALEAVVDTALEARHPGETLIATVQRLGIEPFREATDAVRQATTSH